MERQTKYQVVCYSLERPGCILGKIFPGLRIRKPFAYEGVNLTKEEAEEIQIQRTIELSGTSDGIKRIARVREMPEDLIETFRKSI